MLSVLRFYYIGKAVVGITNQIYKNAVSVVSSVEVNPVALGCGRFIWQQTDAQVLMIYWTQRPIKTNDKSNGSNQRVQEKYGQSFC